MKQNSELLALELESHLAESVQARIELGMSPDEALQDALRALGDPSLASSRSYPLSQQFLASALMLPTSLFLGWQVTAEHLLWTLLQLATLAVVSAFVVTGMRAQRIQWISLVLTSAVWFLVADQPPVAATGAFAMVCAHILGVATGNAFRKRKRSFGAATSPGGIPTR